MSLRYQPQLFDGLAYRREAGESPSLQAHAAGVQAALGREATFAETVDELDLVSPFEDVSGVSAGSAFDLLYQALDGSWEFDADVTELLGHLRTDRGRFADFEDPLVGYLTAREVVELQEGLEPVVFDTEAHRHALAAVRRLLAIAADHDSGLCIIVS